MITPGTTPPMSRRASLGVLGSLGLAVGVSGCQDGTAPSPTTSPSNQESAMGFTNPVYDLNFPDPMIVLGADQTAWAYATNGNGSNVQVLRAPTW